eukprot:458724-Heterocapsa_arctica.AAC.1
MSQMLDEVNKITPDAWLYPPWELTLDPRAASGREGTLPKLVGGVRNGADAGREKGQTETVYGLHGPIPT